jgi:hypothetical protein
MFKSLFVLSMLWVNYPTFSQSFYGEVIDADNSEPLQYANIGIVGKNIGGIAFRDGKFNVILKGLESTDTIKVSYIGYQSQLIPAAALDLGLYHKIRLKATAVVLKPVIVSEQKQSKILGNAKAGRTRTGWGDFQSLRGRTRGLKITGIDCSVKAKSFCFKIDDNEWDSVAFRLNLLQSKDDGPAGESILTENIFVVTGAKQKWVCVDLEHYNIVLCGSVIATLEWVDAWGKTGIYSNVLTFSLSKTPGYEFMKEAGEESGKLQWTSSSPAMYIEVYQ